MGKVFRMENHETKEKHFNRLYDRVNTHFHFNRVYQWLWWAASDPIEDHGWPMGSLQLGESADADQLDGGVPPFGTGSMYEFRFHGENTQQFNEALKVFLTVKADQLELVIHNLTQDGVLQEKIETIAEDNTDWTFTVWNPQDWDRLKNISRSFYRLPDSGIKKPVPLYQRFGPRSPIGCVRGRRRYRMG